MPSNTGRTFRITGRTFRVTGRTFRVTGGRTGVPPVIIEIY